jgi:hypothetical protein
VRSALRLGLGLALALPLGTAARAAVIEDIAGTYTGSWSNTTFSSTGAARLEIGIAGGSITARVDMDGFVFGFLDPGEVVLVGSIVGGNAVFDVNDAPTYGDVTGTIQGANGSASFELNDIPSVMIDRITATGSIAGGVVDLDYVVEFPVGADASGTLAATLPEPGAAGSLAAVLLAGLAQRRRARNGRV